LEHCLSIGVLFSSDTYTANGNSQDTVGSTASKSRFSSELMSSNHESPEDKSLLRNNGNRVVKTT